MEEEVILNKIIEDAKGEASKILKEAEDKAKEIEAKQQEQISQKTESYLEVIENEIKRNKETEIEKAELESRTAILTKKQEQIKAVKEQVRQKIRDLDVKNLNEIYKKIISTFSNKEDLEIIVQDKNKEAVSKELKTLGVKISSEKAGFNEGIIIKDGNIEYNYCFEEIMKFKNEEIEKTIADILFS